MKILNFNNEQRKAEKIIKTDTGIIGEDLNGNTIFEIKGISDFTGFTVTNEDGTSADFDTAQPTKEELLQKQLLETQAILANLQEQILLKSNGGM